MSQSPPPRIPNLKIPKPLKLIKKIIISSFVIIFVINTLNVAIAQDTKIDSLKQLLAESADDSSKAEIFLQLGSLSSSIAPDKQSIDYCLEALGLFNKLNNIPKKAITLNTIGYYYWKLGKLKATIKYYDEALSIFENLGDSTRIARVANNLGAVYWGLSNYNSALDLYQKALKIREKEENATIVTLILNNIGLIYQEWGIFDKALEYHEKALTLSNKTNYLFGRAYSYINLGKCSEEKGDYEKALHYYQLSYNDYYEDKRIGGATSLVLEKIGNVHYKLEQFNEAISYYSRSLQQAKKVNNQFHSSIAEYNLGRTYIKLNQFETAREFIYKSLKKARNNSYNDIIRDNQYILSEIEEKNGNFLKALEFFKTATAMNDSIFNTGKIKTFTELQINYHLEQKEQENAILRKNNDIQRLEIKRQQVIRNSLIIGSIFIITILSLIVNRDKILKKTNAALEKQNINIREINNDKENLIKDLQQEIRVRQQTENALKESEKRLDLTLKGTGVGTWDWMVQTGEIIYNERWAEIAGYTLEELKPINIKTWISLIHPDDQKKSNDLLEKHFTGKIDHYECELRIKHKNGNWIWILDRGKVFERDKDGKPIRMVGTHLDITDKIRIEEEHKNIIKQLRGKLNIKDLQEGILSMCAGCHKIKDEDERWHLPADYLSTHTKLKFSHGMCPDCMKKWYPDYYKKIHSDK